MIQLANYSKSYAGNRILSIDHHKIESGLHLIQGINGSGKTTLFKSIAGIISFRGDCILDRTNIKTEPVEYRKFVNYCEAEPNFPSFLSGRELINFVSQAKKTSPSTLNKITDYFGLREFWGNPISTYSSGMLKKTSLVMAFAGNPKAVLLDEPFTTIDQGSKRILCDLIKQYEKLGCTFLISAHQEPDSIPLEFRSTLIIENHTLRKL